MTVLNLRGSYGAGKTTIFRRLIDEHAHEALYAVNVRQENDRRVPIVWKVGDLYLLGRYRVGSDGIRHRPLAELIQLFNDRGHVLFENVLVSANFQMWQKLRHEFFPDAPLTLALLDTTEQQCLDAVQSRRAEAAALGWKHRQEHVNQDSARGHWKYVQKTTQAWADAGEHVEHWPRDEGYTLTCETFRAAGWDQRIRTGASDCNHYNGECSYPSRGLPGLPFTRRPWIDPRINRPGGWGTINGYITPVMLADFEARERLAPQGAVGNCGHVRGGLDSYSLPLSSTPDFRYCRTCLTAVIPQYGCDSCGTAFSNFFDHASITYHVLTATTWGGKAIEDHFVVTLCAECGGGAEAKQYGVFLEQFKRNGRVEFMVVKTRTSRGYKDALPVQEYTEKQAVKLLSRHTGDTVG